MKHLRNNGGSWLATTASGSLAVNERWNNLVEKDAIYCAKKGNKVIVFPDR